MPTTLSRVMKVSYVSAPPTGTLVSKRKWRRFLEQVWGTCSPLSPLEPFLIIRSSSCLMSSEANFFLLFRCCLSCSLHGVPQIPSVAINAASTRLDQMKWPADHNHAPWPAISLLRLSPAKTDAAQRRADVFLGRESAALPRQHWPAAGESGSRCRGAYGDNSQARRHGVGAPGALL